MSTHEHGKKVLNSLVPLGRKLSERIPEVYAAYGEVRRASMAPGVLDTKTKELIALAISVADKCDGCIASHARGAARAGATVDEVAEMIGVVILMRGGPATVYGPRAMDAFMEYAGTE